MSMAELVGDRTVVSLASQPVTFLYFTSVEHSQRVSATPLKPLDSCAPCTYMAGLRGASSHSAAIRQCFVELFRLQEGHEKQVQRICHIILLILTLHMYTSCMNVYMYSRLTTDLQSM